MASRFWVGGTGTWDATTTTHWSASSGGAGGASVPTSADDVFFDANSGTGTITIPTASNVNCRSLDCTGYTGGLTYTSNTSNLNVNTSLKFVAGMTVTTNGGATNFTATTDNSGAGWGVTTAGKTLGIVIFNGVGGKWVLQDVLTITAGITLTNGTLDTNSQSISCSSFSSSNTNTRTLTLGSSAITLTGTSTVWNIGTASGLTLTSNTATITANGAGAAFSSGGTLTYGGTLALTGSGTATITGTNTTFGNVTRTGTAARGDSLALGVDITVTGTFTANGNSAVTRLFVGSSVAGTAHTISAATVVPSNVDFQDVIAAGAANWDLSAITGLSGDAGGNTGITFTTSISQSNNVLAAGTVWSNAALWPTRVPLPQDDVNFRGFTAGGQTITLDMNRLGRNITFGTGTGGYTVAPNAGSWAVYGNFATVANVFWAGGATNGITLRGRSSHTVSVAGSAMAGVLDVTTPTGTYTLTRAVSMAGAFTLNQGNFNDGGFGVTCLSFTSNSGSTRTLTMSGTWSLTSTAAATVWNIGSTGSLTITATGSTIVLSGASASARTFAGGGVNYGTLTYTVAGSTGGLTITGANTFAGINFSDASNARTLTLPASTVTNVGAWNVNGGASRLISVVSSTAGTKTYLAVPLTDSQGNVFSFRGSNAVISGGGLTGTSTVGHYVGTPDSAALSITGDIDIRAEVTMPDWTPTATGYILGKHFAGGSQGAYYLAVNPAGTLAFAWSTDGTSGTTVSQNSSAPGFVDGERWWVRATMDVDNGSSQHVITFYKSTDGTTWTQISQHTLVGVTSIFDSTQQLTLGTVNEVTAGMTGTLHRVEIRNGIGGTVVASPDFTTTLPVISSDYLSVKDNGAQGAATWYAGAHSTDVSGNSGWIFTAPPSGSTATAASVLPSLTQAEAGTFVQPTYTATAASVLPSLTQAEAGTFVKPTYTATAASVLPSLTQAEVGTFVKPTYTATAASVLPSLTQAEAGTFVKPTYHATAASVLPSLTQAEVGTFVKPVYHATTTSVLPALTQTEVGTFAMATYHATAISVLPALTQAEVGTFVKPVYHVTAASVLPSLTQTEVGTFQILTYTARAASVLPSLTQAEVGTFVKPVYHATVASVLPSLTQAAVARALVAQAVYYAVLSAERQTTATLTASRQVTSAALVAVRQVTGEFA